VLIVTPTGRDATLATSVLQRAGITSLRCADLQQASAELDRGAAALLAAEESLGQEGHDPLTRWLATQEPWSDFPVLLLARPGADSTAVGRALDLLGNVSVLERPMRLAALVSATRSALRARDRQYRTRGHLAERALSEATLRSNDQRKDEFLAMLAHELRNPLAPICNALHALRLQAGDPDATTEIVAMLERQAGHLVRLVDDLLEVSRITRGKIELRRKLVDVSDVIRTAVEASRPLLDAARHRLTISASPLGAQLEADPVRLAQVFSNLLNNAAKYTDPGGLVELDASMDGGELVVVVRDNGIGIPPAMVPRVFDMFVQVDQASARSQGGLGIGLTLVRSIVELHGGTVSVASEGTGKGASFTVRLPVPRAVAAAPPGPSERRAAERSDVDVLIVDDNRDAADSLAGMLALLGARVRIAYGGQDALARLDEARAELVLLDLGMPGIDGLEVARRIRRRADLAGVTLAALTGWGQEHDVRRSMAAGFDRHLTKPADVRSLQELLHAVARNRPHSPSPC